MTAKCIVRLIWFFRVTGTTKTTVQSWSSWNRIVVVTTAGTAWVENWEYLTCMKWHRLSAAMLVLLRVTIREEIPELGLLLGQTALFLSSWLSALDWSNLQSNFDCLPLRYAPPDHQIDTHQNACQLAGWCFLLIMSRTCCFATVATAIVDCCPLFCDEIYFGPGFCDEADFGPGLDFGPPALAYACWREVKFSS